MTTISNWFWSKYQKAFYWTRSQSSRYTKAPNWSANKRCREFRRAWNRYMWTIMIQKFQVYFVYLNSDIFAKALKLPVTLLFNSYACIVIAVAIGPSVFFYKNLKPFFKYSFPSLSINGLEKEIWRKVWALTFFFFFFSQNSDDDGRRIISWIEKPIIIYRVCP